MYSLRKVVLFIFINKQLFLLQKSHCCGHQSSLSHFGNTQVHLLFNNNKLLSWPYNFSKLLSLWRTHIQSISNKHKFDLD